MMLLNYVEIHVFELFFLLSQLMLAITFVQICLNKIFQKNEKGETALHRACIDGNLKKVQMLIGEKVWNFRTIVTVNLS